MHKLQSHSLMKGESCVEEYVPYTRHVSPEVIATDKGSYVCIWKIGGRSHESVSQEDVIRWKEEQNNLLCGIATENFAFWSYIIRRDVNEYPESKFNSEFARSYDANYKKGFEKGSLKINEIYLAVVYRPTGDQFMSFFAKFDKYTQEEKLKRQSAALAKIDDVNRRIRQAFGRRYNAEILTTYEHEGYVYSQPKEFIGQLINGHWARKPITRADIKEDIATSRVFFDKHGEIGELRTSKNSIYFGMSEIVSYPESTEPGQLNILLSANYEFVLCQSFSPLSKQAARGAIEKQIQHLEDSNDPVKTQIDGLRLCLSQVVAGTVVLGEHHATVTTFGVDPDQVRDNTSDVLDLFADRGITAGYVDKALEAGWWAQLPGQFQYRPRPSLITSKNFLGFSSFHNYMTGKPTGNPWGPAVTILKTVSGSPLYFSYHFSRKDQDAEGKRPPGNTMITGMTGTGKTVAVGHLLTQGDKFGPSWVGFDKDQGMSVLVRALGGKYFPLKTGERTGWNPLQMEFTKKNVIFLKIWLRNLATTATEAINHTDERDIDKGLQAVEQLPKKLRRLSVLVQNMPNIEMDDPHARPSAAARLLKWCGDGDYAWVFDNETDDLDLTKYKNYGFDITEFIENATIRSPMMMYLLYRTETMIDGRPFQYVFDEYWKPLEDPYFQWLIKNKQKTIRKQNGMNIFASQEPEDALENPIHSTLISQIATFIFLPNPRAKKKAYMEGFGLTEREFEIIKDFHEDSRMFLIKQGDNCAVGKLDLSKMQDELLVLSGSPDNAEICDAVILELGEDPAIWIPEYVRRVRAAEQQGKYS